jgi:DNA-3-methyladenine glycosylase II
MSLEDAQEYLSSDNVLKDIISRLQILELPNSGNVYNELVKNIVYQQISYRVADVIHARLIELLGDEGYSPKDILSLDFDTLRSVGLSRPKTQYVINISQYFLDNNLIIYNWDDDSDDEIIEKLIEIKGVGTWTAEMILIFELKRPDVLPVKDLAIQQAMKALYGITSEKKELFNDMYKIAESWKPYRSYATLYLWSWCRDQALQKKNSTKTK